ncbi:MAG TPA: hypothetical protein HPP87_04835 [Planctomycetes bacterium]|nr:hypothetical protein [Planctomycetota bacterium]
MKIAAEKTIKSADREIIYRIETETTEDIWLTRLNALRLLLDGFITKETMLSEACRLEDIRAQAEEDLEKIKKSS